MYFFLYKITNKIDGKIYIGCHQTKNLNDGYMGSGKYLKRAITKHGVKNFEKEILKYFDNKEDMFEMESTLVNNDFIKRKDTYNLREGGKGGFTNNDQLKGVTAALEKRKNNQELNDKIILAINNGWKKMWESLSDEEKKKYVAKRTHNHGFAGKSHSQESKQRMAKSHEGKHEGTKNSQYGTCWIHSLNAKINKRIMKAELNSYLNKGWIKGRKMKF